MSSSDGKQQSAAAYPADTLELRRQILDALLSSGQLSIRDECLLGIYGAELDMIDDERRRAASDYHWENGVKVYHSWEAYYDV